MVVDVPVIRYQQRTVVDSAGTVATFLVAHATGNGARGPGSFIKMWGLLWHSVNWWWVNHRQWQWVLQRLQAVVLLVPVVWLLVNLRQVVDGFERAVRYGRSRVLRIRWGVTYYGMLADRDSGSSPFGMVLVFCSTIWWSPMCGCSLNGLVPPG